MKNHQLLVAALFSLLLLAPLVVANELTNGLLRVGPQGQTSSSQLSTPQAAPTQLSRGQASLRGTVDVANLPETSLQNISQTIVPDLHPQGTLSYEQGKNATEQTGFVPPNENTKTVATAASAISPAVSSETVSQVLEGASGVSPNPCGCTPPDPNDAVGPSHVVEMVNVAGIVYLKNGTVAKSTFPLTSFFNVSASMSDPQVLYDTISGRWFASIVDITDNNIQIAVSTSNNPTSIFHLYSVSPGASLPDQPYIGTSDDKFVIAANDYASTSGPFLGVQYWILNKAQLLNGSSTVQFTTNSPDSSMFTLRPVRHLTSSSAFYLVTDCIGSCVTNSMNTANTVELLTVSGVPPGTVNIATHTFSVSTTVQPPNAIQPGRRTPLLVTNDNRILGAVWESNTLWISWPDSCIPSGDSTSRSCLRLVEATVSGTGTPTKNQDFDYAVSGAYLFYPSISLYHGQLVVVYGKSSSSIFPSLLVTGRLPTDAVNTLAPPATIRAGSTVDLSNRYGDYFGAGTDPVPTDNSTFWVSGEYRLSGTGTNWNTAIGQVASLAPDLAIAANPTNITMIAGAIGNSTLTVTGYRLTGNVNLNLTALPIGFSCTLNPTTVTLVTSPTSKLSCTGMSGNYTVKVGATSGSTSRNTMIPVTVQPSQSVGGSILPVNKAIVLLSSAIPGLLALTGVIVGFVIFARRREGRLA